jgi:Domain of unknown function (DUF1905)/Bacteriocin-protection, YdeI or OmpD-Associated
LVKFTTTILQFDEQGEKTGWHYILIPNTIAQQLKPGNKKTFRVKGRVDNYAFNGIALLPMGGGHFIMALNATIRKGIHKRKGAKVQVQMDIDKRPVLPPPGFTESLKDEPDALAYFNKLAPSHRTYFIKWIDSAKTEPTKIRRIAQSVTALAKRLNFGEMLRGLKNRES